MNDKQPVDAIWETLVESLHAARHSFDVGEATRGAAQLTVAERAMEAIRLAHNQESA